MSENQSEVRFKEMLDAGVHFGHLTRKWNPHMAPYIFDEKKGIHIIDLNKTAVKLDEACKAIGQIAKSGKKILFVATKKQAKAAIEEKIGPTGMPFIVERWSGGMLTNFATIRKAIRKMSSIDKMEADGTLATLSKESVFKFHVNVQNWRKTLVVLLNLPVFHRLSSSLISTKKTSLF